MQTDINMTLYAENIDVLYIRHILLHSLHQIQKLFNLPLSLSNTARGGSAIIFENNTKYFKKEKYVT